MKKILLLLLLSSIAYGQTSRTGTFALPLWTTGDTLKAGSAALSNSTSSGTGLNNLALRLDTLFNSTFNSTGLIKRLYGISTQDLTISTNSSYAKYVKVDDSLDVVKSIRVQGDGLVYGNLQIGGYVTLDSIQGNMQSDSVQSNTVSYKLYAQDFADASTSNNDTSGYTTNVWRQDTTRNADLTYKRKAKFIYIHKEGMKYLTAYFKYYIDALVGSGGSVKVIIRNTSGVIVITTTSSGGELQSTSYADYALPTDVSGLTADATYYVEFQMRDADAGQNLFVKEFVMMAESR
jgi:hypothetical protein